MAKTRVKDGQGDEETGETQTRRGGTERGAHTGAQVGSGLKREKTRREVQKELRRQGTLNAVSMRGSRER